MTDRNSLGRRDFLKGVAGATVGVVGFPYIVSSSAFGNASNVPPSERITMGCIGVGWQGGSNLNSYGKKIVKLLLSAMLIKIFFEELSIELTITIRIKTARLMRIIGIYWLAMISIRYHSVCPTIGMRYQL